MVGDFAAVSFDGVEALPELLREVQVFGVDFAQLRHLLGEQPQDRVDRHEVVEDFHFARQVVRTHFVVDESVHLLFIRHVSLTHELRVVFLALREIGHETVGKHGHLVAQVFVSGPFEVLPVDLAFDRARVPEHGLLVLPAGDPDLEPELVLLRHFLLEQFLAPVEELVGKLVLAVSQVPGQHLLLDLFGNKELGLPVFLRLQLLLAELHVLHLALLPEDFVQNFFSSRGVRMVLLESLLDDFDAAHEVNRLQLELAHLTVVFEKFFEDHFGAIFDNGAHSALSESQTPLELPGDPKLADIVFRTIWALPQNVRFQPIHDQDGLHDPQISLGYLVAHPFLVFVGFLEDFVSDNNRAPSLYENVVLFLGRHFSELGPPNFLNQLFLLEVKLVVASLAIVDHGPILFGVLLFLEAYRFEKFTALEGIVFEFCGNGRVFLRKIILHITFVSVFPEKFVGLFISN